MLALPLWAFGSSNKHFLFKILKRFFSNTVYIQYYFILVSGDTIMYFTKCFLDVFSTQLVPYIVIPILLTIFYMLYFTSHDIL